MVSPARFGRLMGGGETGVRPAILRPRHRMRRNDPRLGQRAAQFRGHEGLARADVADQRIGGKARRDRRGGGRHRAHRHAEDDEVRPLPRLPGLIGDAVDQGQRPGAVAHRRIEIEAGQADPRQALVHRPRDRGADQAEPDDRYRLEWRIHGVPPQCEMGPRR